MRGSQQELDLECADHLRFAGERAPEKTFVGRETELQRIRDYLHSETNQPFVVHGPSGSGKTALLGKIIQEVTPSRSADGTRVKTGPIVLSRFIGTTPDSSNLRSLLSSLCRELRQDFELTSPLPTDLNELIDEFYSHLGKATAARPVVVFLDALDQLDAADYGRSAFWIRSPLSLRTAASCHARMVVSCLSPSEEFPEDSDACEAYRELKVRTLLGNDELGALEENDARKLFARWLRASTRDLTETQQKMISRAIRKTSACRQPLFLKVLFEEARRWRSFDAPSAIPESLARLLDELFIRLGKPSEHGELIGIALSCLVSARYGLSEGELLEILYTHERYEVILAKDNKRNGHELPPNSTRIPIAPWTRLRSDLAPYLSERSAPGSAVIHFYHRNLFKAVRERFLPSEEQQRQAHGRLAEYFNAQDYWLESLEEQRRRAKTLPPTPRPANVRKVDELPWQLLQAADWQKSEQLLTDMAFLEGKTEAGMVFDLMGDFGEALRHLPMTYPRRWILERLHEALGHDIQFIAWQPSILFQCLWNRCWWYDHPATEPHYDTPARGWPPKGPPWKRRGLKLWQLLESWCTGKQIQLRGSLWLRSLRPPAIALGTALRAVLDRSDSGVRSVAFSPDGQLIAAGYFRTASIWDAALGRRVARLRGLEWNVNAVVFSPDGRRIVTGGDDVRIWDVTTGANLANLRGQEHETTGVAFSPDGHQLVSTSRDKTVRFWDGASGLHIACLHGHDEAVLSVAFCPDGRRVVSGSADGTVRVWDAATHMEVACYHVHAQRINSVVYSPDGRRIVSASSDNTIHIWDAVTGTQVGSLRGHDSDVLSLAFSPDGNRIVSGSADKTIRVWDARTGEQFACLRGVQDRVLCVALSPDGKRIASASDDERLCLWEVTSRDEPLRRRGHKVGRLGVAFSKDGRRIVTWSDDEMVRVWDAATALEMGGPEDIGTFSTTDLCNATEDELGQLGRECRWVPASGSTFPRWRARRDWPGTVIEFAEQQESVAMVWVPEYLDGVRRHPTANVWAARDLDGNLCVFSLEGDETQIKTGLKTGIFR